MVAQYRYLKDGDKLSFIKDKVYNCIGYDNGMLAIVDETGEAYLYEKENIELITE